MSGLGDALDSLVAEHDRIGSPLGRHLRRRSPQEIEPLLRGLPDPVASGATQWFELVAGGLGATAPGAGSIALYPFAYPYSPEEAVRTRDLLLRGAEAMERDRTGALQSGVFWRTSWIPIVAADPEWIALDCDRQASARVLRVCWEPDEGLDHTGPICPTLADWIYAIVDRFRAGDYRWDAQHDQLTFAGDAPQAPVPACGTAMKDRSIAWT